MKLEMKKEIFIVIRKDGDSTFLMPLETLDTTELENGELVGRYKLVETKRVKITTELI